MEDLIIPFDRVRNINIPTPRSVILVALSDYRSSSCSNDELARHICASLYNIANSIHADIKPSDNAELLRFDECKDASK